MNTELIFGVFLFVNICVTFRSSSLWTKYVLKKATTGGDNTTNEAEIQRHRSLLKRYLIVYLLATLGDWLQGPYVYALYSSYGYSQHDNAILFVAGFGSSMVFGSFIGGMADWGGRRCFVILYAISYALSCATKHFNNFHVLMIGRLLGGISTSLLFSIFEAWLVRAHSDQKIGKHLLNNSFSSAAYGNSIIAILAGLMANKAAEMQPLTPVSTTTSFHMGGYIGPFDLSLLVMIICGCMASYLWEENYGDTSSGHEEGGDSSQGKSESNWHDGLKNAYVVTMRSQDILLCGIISSLFEGSMYVFVFMWTPHLTSFTNPENEDEKLPFGLIFSTFMVCCMAGSSIFSIFVTKIKGEVLAVALFVVGSLSMAAVATATNDTMAFVAMNIFEVCVGMYFPIMGTMKGSIVPEDKRAAIYNLYRIPLNFIVLVNLLTDFTPSTAFTLNTVMLCIAALLQFQLMRRRLNIQHRSEIMTKAMQASSSSETTAGDDKDTSLLDLKDSKPEDAKQPLQLQQQPNEQMDPLLMEEKV